MLYSPTSEANIATVSEFLKTMALSAVNVDRPLREINCLTIVLDDALASINALTARNSRTGRTRSSPTQLTNTTTGKKMENNELKRTVGLRVLYMTDAEYQVGYLNAEEKTENSIVEVIEQHRKPFTEGRTVGVSGAIGATKEQWQVIARDSDKAAKAELLKSSAELVELNRLEKIADEARKAAEAKERELNALWSEYSSLPDRISAAQRELESIRSSIADLDPAKLNEAFKRHFRAVIDGAITDPFAQVQMAAVIVTADLRREVLNEKAGELEAQLVALRKRNKELSKK